MPVILLSAVSDEHEQVRAFEAGADDYSSSRFDRANSWPVCSQICDEPSPEAKSHAWNWTASKSTSRHEQSAATVSWFTSHQSTHSADARPRRRVHRHASAAMRVSIQAWPGSCSSATSATGGGGRATEPAMRAARCREGGTEGVAMLVPEPEQVRGLTPRHVPHFEAVENDICAHNGPGGWVPPAVVTFVIGVHGAVRYASSW